MELSKLPEEVLLHVIKYLDDRDLGSVAQACGHLHRLVTDATIWADRHRPQVPGNQKSAAYTGLYQAAQGGVSYDRVLNLSAKANGAPTHVQVVQTRIGEPILIHSKYRSWSRLESDGCLTNLATGVTRAWSGMSKIDAIHYLPYDHPIIATVTNGTPSRVQLFDADLTGASFGHKSQFEVDLTPPLTVTFAGRNTSLQRYPKLAPFQTSGGCRGLVLCDRRGLIFLTEKDGDWEGVACASGLGRLNSVQTIPSARGWKAGWRLLVNGERWLAGSPATRYWAMGGERPWEDLSKGFEVRKTKSLFSMMNIGLYPYLCRTTANDLVFYSLVTRRRTFAISIQKNLGNQPRIEAFPWGPGAHLLTVHESSIYKEKTRSCTWMMNLEAGDPKLIGNTETRAQFLGSGFKEGAYVSYLGSPKSDLILEREFTPAATTSNHVISKLPTLVLAVAGFYSCASMSHKLAREVSALAGGSVSLYATFFTAGTWEIALLPGIVIDETRIRMPSSLRRLFAILGVALLYCGWRAETPALMHSVVGCAGGGAVVHLFKLWVRKPTYRSNIKRIYKEKV